MNMILCEGSLTLLCMKQGTPTIYLQLELFSVMRRLTKRQIEGQRTHDHQSLVFLANLEISQLVLC